MIAPETRDANGITARRTAIGARESSSCQTIAVPLEARRDPGLRVDDAVDLDDLGTLVADQRPQPRTSRRAAAAAARLSRGLRERRKLESSVRSTSIPSASSRGGRLGGLRRQRRRRSR